MENQVKQLYEITNSEVEKPEIIEEIEVEELAIDGICGVY